MYFAFTIYFFFVDTNGGDMGMTPPQGVYFSPGFELETFHIPRVSMYTLSYVTDLTRFH